MNKHFKFIFTLLSGVAIGSAVTWHALNDKYKKITNEEIKSVREQFSGRLNRAENTATTAERTVADYNAVLGINKENGYTNYSDVKTGGEEADKIDSRDYIYKITEDDVGKTEFHIESLDYYADEVLVNDVGDIIYDLDMTVGNCLDGFMEYESDAIYIRNEQLKIDYEVLKDPRQYEEVRPSEV